MIKEFLEKHGDYRSDRSFKDLTTLRMGGGIAHYVEPYNLAELKEIVRFLKANRLPFKLIGNGSNMLCGSSFYDGVVISLRHFDDYEIDDNEVYVKAGVLMPYLSQVLAKEGLSGLEFASGIPGTVGGLVYMNAGAYKKDMSQIVKEVVVLKDDEVVTMNRDELKFAYRYSIFQEHPHWFIIACRMKLKKGDSKEISDLMKERYERRRASQPLDMPSPGSCFRNPDNDFAWKLIDGIGYRGHKFGGAMVSDKHSNFIVNYDNGKAEDYLELVYEIQDKVRDKYGVKLIMEVEKFNC